MTLVTEKPSDAILVIDARAKKYADARNVLNGHVTDYNLALEALRKKHLPDVRKAADKCSALEMDLRAEIKPNAHLFVKPRTITLHGIKVGFQKGKGKLLFDNIVKLAERVRALLPKAQADLLLKTTVKPVAKTMQRLDGATLKKLGVTVVGGIDEVYIDVAEGEVEKLVAAILGDAAKPTTEEDDS